MTETIIQFRPRPRNQRRAVKVEVKITIDGQEFSGELPLLERCLVAHALADQVAIALRLNGDVKYGHSIAASAHLTAIAQREGVKSQDDEDPIPDVELS